jgi:hypothetical protein
MVTWMSFFVLAWVSLQWNANAERDLRTYRVYERCSEASRLDLSSGFQDYTEVGLVTTWRTEVEPVRWYYFCVTAVNTSGLESDASNMVLVYFGGELPVLYPAVLPAWLVEEQNK